ncbi:MAG: hypothetical protein QCH35_04275 [Methanomicrobiaceae archaeon]|nr:hypothetical protein [Methanomicrobiaceae archaeon]
MTSDANNPEKRGIPEKEGAEETDAPAPPAKAPEPQPEPDEINELGGEPQREADADDWTGKKVDAGDTARREAPPEEEPDFEWVRQAITMDKIVGKEDPPQPKKKGKSKVILAVVLVLVVILAGGLLTLGVTVTEPREGMAYPYTTTYVVLFPDGERVTVANTPMMALTYENEMIIDVNGRRDKIVVGEEKLVSERRAIISVFGKQVLATNFQIYMKYLGMESNKAQFYLTVKRSNDIPQFLIDRLLPSEIEARPA